MFEKENDTKQHLAPRTKFAASKYPGMSPAFKQIVFVETRIL